MLTDAASRVADGVDPTIHDQAIREYVASAAHELGGRWSDFASVEHQRRGAGAQRAAELERTRAAHARAVRKQLRAQRRASLTFGERVADSFRRLGGLRVVWLLGSLAVFAGVALMAGLTDRPTALAAGAGIYIVVLWTALRIANRLARQLPEGYNDRVNDQLNRVKEVFAAR